MYTLTIIRLNSNTATFENTEAHDIGYTKGTLLSELLAIPADDQYSTIRQSVESIPVGGRKTIQLENVENNELWFCYITRYV